MIEEPARAGMTGPGLTVHSDMLATYIPSFSTKEQKQTLLPKTVSGEVIGALAMTEAGADSDLKAIHTTAVRHGNDYIGSGQKVYIFHGTNCDSLVVVSQTNPAAGARGVSLILEETTRPGFERGKN